ncbi:MAG: peptide chain release factor 3 [Chloroflexi bacterium]|nr:peptide chain release factor 3 [Chloroflexota bacterium]
MPTDTYTNRRTFAIISHPDAGKTTLTEKLLLYGSAIHLAGNVRARRDLRATTSDWMEMERQRGISITSTVLQFPYRGHVLNLLDTPGHQDFSEDTYRTLSAVDCGVMVLDGARGIESQTRRLFDVCRARGVPIFAFVNKMDRPARDPLDLLDEIEGTLGMQPVPVNWPLGDGPDFCGVYDRAQRSVYLYERTTHNERMAPETLVPLEALRGNGRVPARQVERLLAEVELLDGLGITLDLERVRTGEQIPVFFGSALTNFGVRLFLDAFIDLAPMPQPYESDAGPVAPEREAFSGFVFKIQANMNPRHHDSIAFLRICSGRFSRGMTAVHAQSGKTQRLQRPYKVFAAEREVIDEAVPGDIIGLPSRGELGIGDTLCEGSIVRYPPIPRFQPECFSLLRNRDLNKLKQFTRGLEQLEREGAVQVLHSVDALKREPILAVVGALQFDVVRSRLENEYGVLTDIEHLPYSLARWVHGPAETIARLPMRNDVVLTHDRDGGDVVLFSTPFYLRYVTEHYPGLRFESQS